MNSNEINRKAMKGYRFLEKGEIVKIGDEIDTSKDSSPVSEWTPVIEGGDIVPDPMFIAHRVYRRKSIALR